MSSSTQTTMRKYLRKFSKVRWLPFRHWYDLRDLMRLRSTTTDKAIGRKFRFTSESFYAYQRSRELLSKEPETNAWLEKHLRADDIFLDIGANIGVFTLYVAARLGEKGHVYACEPHMPSAIQLMRNVVDNDLGDRVSVLSVAIGGSNGFTPFTYKRWRSGASGSQLASGLDMPKSVGVELKCERTIDQLVADGVMPSPTLIKMDTDGVELLITQGARNLLTGTNRPRALMVEIQIGDYSKQKAYMESVGYKLVNTALYAKAQAAVDAGASLDEVGFNGFFEPADA